ncbi:2-keto-4-pentenoate hydratase [Marinomonas algarum]|uniref:2-keto-4-pentenoate hydratase n=1 Tax=Marinomonas algarum TaxID=2883105 RepID=A0A9X1LFK2_9GAMM|nr:fumarylacetoacetate hydrolase family protein [Marinomonas algarum]MCB5163035.1 2-keto-4-pentenoate hydratase [Marinomonas algarum]
MTTNINAIAEELIHARQTCKSIAPISQRYKGLTIADAYAIQTLIGDQRLAQGGRIVGYKVGLTSKAVQKQLNVNEPDFGLLFADMEIRKDQNLDRDSMIAPKAEGEIGFVFNRDIEEADLTLSELKSAIDYFFPVVEIVDSAIADWKITLIDTVADNASSALYVPGDTFYSPHGVDFTQLELRIQANDIDISGNGAACLGNPLYATLWLVRKMVSLGRPIRKGQVVLSGALAPMVSLQKDQTINFDFKGLETIKIKTV